MIHLKSEREIDRMRESADLVGRTLAEVARHIEAGVTLNELDAVAEDFIRTHGAEPAFKGYQVGQNVFPSTLCTSVNDVVVHGIPNGYELQNGDLLSIDCGVKLDGYFGDSAFTFAVGTPSDEDAALCRTTYEALHKGVAQAVADNRIGDISSAVQSHCETHGYGIVRDLVGHGIGQDLHEDPQVLHYGKPGTGLEIAEGMTFTIEPMLNAGKRHVRLLGDGWTVVTKDHSLSAQWEHTVAVTAQGCEVLTLAEGRAL